jgi:hypothetical protein
MAAFSPHPPEALEVNRDQARHTILDHLFNCDTCLDVIADLTLPSSMCEVRCTRLKVLLASAGDIPAPATPIQNLDCT